MRNSLSKMHYLLLVLLLFALAGCGANHSGTSANQSPGQVTAKVQMAKTLQAPASVVTIRLVVTGSGIPTASKDFPAAAGGGTVEVYPGTDLIVTAYGINASGGIEYEGFATKVNVAAGATTNVGTILTSAPIIKAENAPCQSCHQSTRDITGQNLVINYKQSGHYTNKGWTTGLPFNGATEAGCAGCHGTQHNDLTPSASGRCYVCHAANLSLRHTAPGTVLVNARYLSLGNNNCSACHEPHNPIKGVGYQERKDWAASGHGDVNALAWMDYNFTLRASCNACHTPAGFVKAIGNGWTDTTALTGTAMQPLTCDGCHSSNDFANSVRTLSAGTVNGGYKAGMGGYGAAAKASIQFYNVGESNLCIPCHAGRENGDSLKKAVLSTYSGNFLNPHYLAAAATFYGVGGFQFYTSGVHYNKYGAAGKVGRNANWNHGRLGMDNFTAASLSATNVGVTRGTGNKGQCVACHLGPANTHTFDAAVVADTTKGTGNSLTRTCYGCHSNTNPAAAAVTIAQFIDEEKEIWHRLFDFYTWQLGQYGIYFNNNAYPYFFSDAASTTSYKFWNRVTVGTTFGGAGVQDAQRTMGAAMNLKLLVTEKGSFVHNRAFGRALMADSIAYLQKGNDMEWYNQIKPTQNELIKFSDYSAARPLNYPGQVGPNISITQLKSYLTRSATGGYTRR